MTAVASFQYGWTARPDVHVPDGWTAISDADLAHGGIKGLRIESMAEPGDHMPTWAWDFLQVARAAYVADKKAGETALPTGGHGPSIYVCRSAIPAGGAHRR